MALSLVNRADRAHVDRTFTTDIHGHEVNHLARTYLEASRVLLADQLTQTLVDDERGVVVEWLVTVDSSASFDPV